MRISTCQRRSRRSRRSTFALDCIISRDASGVNEVKVDVSNVNDETWHGTYLCVAAMLRWLDGGCLSQAVLFVLFHGSLWFDLP